MRRTLIALLVTAAAVALPTGVAQAKAKPKCTAKGSHTLLRTSRVRVYEVGNTDFTVYGCLFSTGKRKAVATYTSCGCSVGDDPTPQVWVNREALAVNEYSCPPPGLGDCVGDVSSFDLRRRALTYRETVPKGFVAQLVVKGNGSFAYLAADTVRKADSAGIGELDAGPVEAGSLARAGSIVYWTKAAQPYSARLQ